MKTFRGVRGLTSRQPAHWRSSPGTPAAEATRPCYALSRGFTLIELLVVIAIIAILAAILFPVFAQARESARQTTCLSNCKQIGISMAMYIQDYDGSYPSQPGDGMKTLAAGGKVGTYYDALQPYEKNQQIWLDPSGSTAGGDAPLKVPAMTYHMNGNLITKEGLAEAAVGNRRADRFAGLGPCEAVAAQPGVQRRGVVVPAIAPQHHVAARALRRLRG